MTALKKMTQRVLADPPAQLVARRLVGHAIDPVGWIALVDNEHVGVALEKRALRKTVVVDVKNNNSPVTSRRKRPHVPLAPVVSPEAIHLATR